MQGRPGEGQGSCPGHGVWEQDGNGWGQKMGLSTGYNWKIKLIGRVVPPKHGANGFPRLMV